MPTEIIFKNPTLAQVELSGAHQTGASVHLLRGQTEGHIVGVLVHQPLGVEPEASPGHVLLVLCHRHLLDDAHQLRGENRCVSERNGQKDGAFKFAFHGAIENNG